MSLARKVALNAAALTAGRLLMMASGVVTVGISTRYLGTADYGAFAIAMAFVSIFGAVPDLGLSTIGAREIAKRPHETRLIVGSIFTVTLIISAIAAVACFGGTNLVYRGADDRLLREGIAILLLTLLAAAPNSAADAYFVSAQKAYLSMIGSLAGTVAALTLLVLATTLDWGFLGVVSAYAGGWAVHAAVMTSLLLRRVPISLSFDVALWKQLLRWSLPVAGLALVATLYARLDIVLLSFLRSDSDAGIYSVAYKVVDILVMLPPYVMVTLLPAIARLDHHSQRLAELTQKAFAALQVGAVAVFVLLVGFADEVVEIVGGSRFERSAPVLQILMVGVAATFAGHVFGNALVALNQQARMLKLGLALLAFNLALNLALIPPWGVYGAAVALSVTEVVGLLLIARLYKSVGRLPTIYRGPQVLLAAGAMAVVVLAKTLPFASSLGPVIVVALLGSASLAVYVGCLYAMRAMPAEVHTAIVVPLWRRLRPG